MSHAVSVKMSAGATVIWRRDWGWRIHILGGSLTGLKVDFSGKFQFLPIWASSWVSWVSSWPGSWLSPEQAIQERCWESHGVFYDPASEVAHCHFCNILLVAQVGLIHGGRGLGNGMNTPWWGASGATWDARLPQEPALVQVSRDKDVIPSLVGSCQCFSPG